MTSHDKTKDELLSEIAELRRKNAEFKRSESEHKLVEKKIQEQNDFLHTVLESLAHPFYVIPDFDTFSIRSKLSSWNSWGWVGAVKCSAP